MSNTMSNLHAAKDTAFINTAEGITRLIDFIAPHDNKYWGYDPLYIDILSRERLSRDGNISLLTLLVHPRKGPQSSHVIDVHTLGDVAFSTVGSRGKSMKDILESPRFLKVFFDVRNDSHGLYAHYGIRLQGVRDVQLMESACRPTTQSRRFLFGLGKCIEEVTVMNRQERDQWRLCKETGERLWNPEKGGSHNVFNKRPISIEILAYCVGDVEYLPALYEKFRVGTGRWDDLVTQESQNRVHASEQAGYLPHGPGRAMSPWSPVQNKLLDSWMEVKCTKRLFWVSSRQ